MRYIYILILLLLLPLKSYADAPMIMIPDTDNMNYSIKSSDGDWVIITTRSNWEDEKMYDYSDLVGYIIFFIVVTGSIVGIVIGALVSSWKDKEVQAKNEEIYKLKEQAVLLGHAEWEEKTIETSTMHWKKK